MTTVLNIPGYENSGENHWQTHWENRFDWLERVQMPDWIKPIRDEWVDTLNTTILGSDGSVYLIAHSLGCTTVAHLSDDAKAKVKGAFLVSNPDLENNDTLPETLYTFNPIPKTKLSFPTIMIASTNDPYCPKNAAERFARDWGSELLFIGDKGHISGADVGSWEEGQKIFLDFMGGLEGN